MVPDIIPDTILNHTMKPDDLKQTTGLNVADGANSPDEPSSPEGPSSPDPFVSDVVIEDSPLSPPAEECRQDGNGLPNIPLSPAKALTKEQLSTFQFVSELIQQEKPRAIIKATKSIL